MLPSQFSRKWTAKHNKRKAEEKKKMTITQLDWFRGQDFVLFFISGGANQMNMDQWNISPTSTVYFALRCKVRIQINDNIDNLNCKIINKRHNFGF